MPHPPARGARIRPRASFPLAGLRRVFPGAELDLRHAERCDRRAGTGRRQHAEELGHLKVLVSGSSGLIGTGLVARLGREGHEVVRLVRREPEGGGEARWRPETGEVDVAATAQADAVLHLAGENIGEGRWTKDRRKVLVESRVDATRRLAEHLAGLPSPPPVFVQAPAVGFYGDRGEVPLDEESASGEGFLASLCERWEAASREALAGKARVVHVRLGVVLSANGGALPKMVRPIKLGVGGRIGSGRQVMSWIERGDAIAAFEHALVTESLAGPVNAVSPNPVTNAELTAALGRILSRPTVLPLPAFAARIVLGKMADDLLLASARVEPRKLLASGFSFAHPELEEALHHVLRR